MNSRLHDRLKEREILKIFGDACEGVAQLHYAKPPVIHRDIKVENLLVSNSDDYKLCDFGSATTEILPPRSINFTVTKKKLDLIHEDVQKHTTLQYRAPELCDVYSGRGINEKVDIWALGVMLYKLCYYITPFEKELSSSITAIMSGRYTIPTDPPFSRDMIALIQWCLLDNPVHRPTIFQLIHEISRLRGIICPLDNIYSEQPVPASVFLTQLANTMASVQTYNNNNSNNNNNNTNLIRNHLPLVPTLPSPLDPMRRGRPLPNAITTTTTTTINSTSQSSLSNPLFINSNQLNVYDNSLQSTSSVNGRSLRSPSPHSPVNNMSIKPTITFPQPLIPPPSFTPSNIPLSINQIRPSNPSPSVPPIMRTFSDHSPHISTSLTSVSSDINTGSGLLSSSISSINNTSNKMGSVQGSKSNLSTTTLGSTSESQMDGLSLLTSPITTGPISVPPILSISANHNTTNTISSSTPINSDLRHHQINPSIGIPARANVNINITSPLSINNNRTEPLINTIPVDFPHKKIHHSDRFRTWIDKFFRLPVYKPKYVTRLITEVWRIRLSTINTNTTTTAIPSKTLSITQPTMSMIWLDRISQITYTNGILATLRGLLLVNAMIIHSDSFMLNEVINRRNEINRITKEWERNKYHIIDEYTYIYGRWLYAIIGYFTRIQSYNIYMEGNFHILEPPGIQGLSETQRIDLAIDTQELIKQIQPYFSYLFERGKELQEKFPWHEVIDAIIYVLEAGFTLYMQLMSILRTLNRTHIKVKSIFDSLHTLSQFIGYLSSASELSIPNNNNNRNNYIIPKYRPSTDIDAPWSQPPSMLRKIIRRLHSRGIDTSIIANQVINWKPPNCRPEYGSVYDSAYRDFDESSDSE